VSQAASGGRPRTGLRERKKTKTRFAIQQEALRLFRRQGYQATTVEQIAEAAEVSPSTVFRYFPTKDALVLTDDYDPIMIERFHAQPAGLSAVGALRGALRETFQDMPSEQVKAAAERRDLVLAVPELRAAFADFVVGSIRTLSELIGERTGRAVDDPEVMGVSGAFLGVLLAGYLVGGDLREQLGRIDDQLGHLESGFTF
jgi:AcrR family transcriptional regulator